MTPTFGLAAGALVAGALVQYAPAPTRLVYAVLLAATIATAVSRQGAFEAGLRGLVSKLKTSSNPQKTVNTTAPKLNSLNAKANAAWRAAGLVKCAG